MPNMYQVKSAAATQFTTAIAALGAAVETETIAGFTGDGAGEVRRVNILSKENLAWQVEMFDTNSYPIAVKQFAASDAKQTAYSGTTYYSYDALLEWDIPNTRTAGVVIGLRNFSDAIKTAGSDGAVIITFSLVK